jgi:antitoxin component YwqK of YwqJK toxin-antitoxin module
MKGRIVQLVAGIVYFQCSAHGAPIDDLSSPAQETRDAAAKIVRETHVAPPAEKWDALLEKIYVGAEKERVLEILKPLNLRAEGSINNCEFYRLDDSWVLQCWYRSGILSQRSLSQRVREMWVAPPPDFAGVWTLYYANGQRSSEIHYLHGRYSGEFISFYSTGPKSYTQHYGPEGEVEGEDAGWYAEGPRNYKGQYKNGKQDGQWIWWYVGGLKKSETNYRDGKLNGLQAEWSQFGQMTREANYKDGVKEGREASWNERGDLEFEHEYKDGKVIEETQKTADRHHAAPLYANLTSLDGQSALSEEFRTSYDKASEAAMTSHSLKPVEDLLNTYRRPEEQAELQVALGYLYSQRSGFVHPDKAVEHFTKALNYELPPSLTPKILTLLGNSREQLKELDEALDDYIRGVLFCLRYDLPPATSDSATSRTRPKMDPNDPKYEQPMADLRVFDREQRFERELLMARYGLIEAIKRAAGALKLSNEDFQHRVELISGDEARTRLLFTFVTSENVRPR